MLDMMAGDRKVGEMGENMVGMAKAYYESLVWKFHHSSNSSCQMRLYVITVTDGDKFENDSVE